MSGLILRGLGGFGKNQQTVSTRAKEERRTTDPRVFVANGQKTTLTFERP
jgi:hypothetical protein